MNFKSLNLSFRLLSCSSSKRSSQRNGCTPIQRSHRFSDVKDVNVCFNLLEDAEKDDFVDVDS